MSDEARPKPLFFVVLVCVIAALVAYGFRSVIFPKSESGKPVTISQEELTDVKGVEAADSNVPTTVKEYVFKPSEKLPAIKQTSGYDPMNARTVKFALNVWAGWAPIILQNEGANPGKIWTTPGGEPFKVELVLIDDPVKMRDAFATGEVHIGWATLDMLPLLIDGFVAGVWRAVPGGIEATAFHPVSPTTMGLPVWPRLSMWARTAA